LRNRREWDHSRLGAGFAAAVASAVLVALFSFGISSHALAAPAPDRFQIGFADGLMASTDPATRADWQDRGRAAGASLLRINLLWDQVAREQPSDPADPSDPAYDFATLDAAIRDADARGYEVMLTVFSAPAFAEAERPPGVTAPAGTYKPIPGALGAFATALATRYSGHFAIADDPLPAVPYLQAWLEPNLSTYLTPQWTSTATSSGLTPASPSHYREMLNAFYAGAKRGNPAVEVVGAGTAPYGDEPGGLRIRPLPFWRQVLCLRGSLEPARSCPARSERARMDVFAHHPINTSGGPARSAVHPDDATGADFGDLTAILRAAEAAKLIRPGGDRELWATDSWWESDPPDGFNGYPPARQARFIEQTLFQLWRAGASAGILLQIRDDPIDAARPTDTLQSGIFDLAGNPKPALTAVRFPFVVSREGDRGLLAWGIAPLSGKVEIKLRRRNEWQRVDSTSVNAGGVFALRVGGLRRGVFRAEIGAQRSLAWKLGGH